MGLQLKQKKVIKPVLKSLVKDFTLHRDAGTSSDGTGPSRDDWNDILRRIKVVGDALGVKVEG